MKSLLRVVGLVLLVVGAFMAAYYFLIFDPSIAMSNGNGRIANLERLGRRQNGLILGIALSAFGLVSVIFGRDTHQDMKKRIAKDRYVNFEDIKK